MKSYHSLRARRRACAATLLFTYLSSILAPLVLPQDDDEEEETVYELSPFTIDAGGDIGYRASSSLTGTRINTNLSDLASAINVVSADFLSGIGSGFGARINTSMGATLGGAQDIGYFRDQAKRGYVPSPLSLTPEGLFSEHDLPIEGIGQEGFLIDVVGQSIQADLPNQPDVEILAQLGFSSGIDQETWKPAPLNLIAVVDKSGSMNGQPLDLVRESLKQVASQLGSNDQLSVILFGSESIIHISTTKMEAKNKAEVLRQIDTIHSAGSTRMEAGLRMGYQLARETAASFEGATRVMLFTDEQPNLGDTSAQGFMTMAENAAANNIGLTTIGVGNHFEAALAQKISEVRGGNLFYFPDRDAMIEKFRKELDTMLLQLATDLKMTIRPKAGLQITGLYGIPGDAVEWDAEGNIVLEVATIFASRDKGAIYFSLGNAPKEIPIGTEIANVSLQYTQTDNNAQRTAEVSIPLLSKNDAGIGLKRGLHLVDEYTSLMKASLLSQSENYNEAFHTMDSFQKRFSKADPKSLELENEHELAILLTTTLESLSEIRLESNAVNPKYGKRGIKLIGEWMEEDSNKDSDSHEIIRFTEEGRVQIYTSSAEDPLHFVNESRISVDRNRVEFKDLYSK